jgi:hypothetical protein
MKIKYLLLLLLPLLVVLDLQWFTLFTYLLRQPSDASVGLGVGTACMFVAFNFMLFRFIYLNVKQL